MDVSCGASRLYRDVVGGLGLAQQNEVVRLVRRVQGILDFHGDAAGQEPGFAPAAYAGAAFEIRIKAGIFCYLQQVFPGGKGTDFWDRAKVKVGKAG